MNYKIYRLACGCKQFSGRIIVSDSYSPAAGYVYACWSWPWGSVYVPADELYTEVQIWTPVCASRPGMGLGYNGWKVEYEDIFLLVQIEEKNNWRW